MTSAKFDDGFTYRNIKQEEDVMSGIDEPEKKWIYLLWQKINPTFLWFWIFFGCFTEPEMIFGHWPEIKASEWTDEELGIPPDDVEGVEEIIPREKKGRVPNYIGGGKNWQSI